MIKKQFTDGQAHIVAEVLREQTGKQFNVSCFLCLSSTFSVLYEAPDKEQKILTESSIINIASSYQRKGV